MKTSSLGMQDCEVLHCRNVEERGTRLLASLSCFVFAFLRESPSAWAG